MTIEIRKRNEIQLKAHKRKNKKNEEKETNEEREGKKTEKHASNATFSLKACERKLSHKLTFPLESILVRALSSDLESTINDIAPLMDPILLLKRSGLRTEVW